MFLNRLRPNCQSLSVGLQPLPRLCLIIAYLHLVSANLLLPKKWEVTQTKFDKLNYVWTLSDSVPQTGLELCFNSHLFSPEKNIQQRWLLTLCLSTRDAKAGEFFEGDAISKVTNREKFARIGLFYISGDADIIDSNYTLTLMNGTLQEIRKLNGEIRFERRKMNWKDDYLLSAYQRQNGFLYQELIFDTSQHNVKEVDGVVVIGLEASLQYRSTRNFSSNECRVTSPTARANIQSQYKDQYLDYKQQHNLIIETKSCRAITTSNSLLAAWSIVWQDKSYYERRLGPINFEEFDYEVVDEMLHFLHYGEAPRMKNMTKELFTIAKKFQLKDLKKLAEEEICNSLLLKLDNIIEDLVFAVENEAITVKSRIINFIASQSMKIFNTSPFKQFKESHPKLMQDILNVRAEIEAE